MSIPKSVTKAHATGNDFIAYLDSDGRFEPTADEVRQLCDRHFGIGADGLLRLTKPQYVADLSEAQVAACDDGDAEWFMDYRNADGSLAEMCGNGTRAITLFAQRCGVASTQVEEPFRLGTRAGVKTLRPLGDVAPYGRDVFRVDMGSWRRGDLDAFTVTIPGTPGAARGTFVDMGNPHVVCVIEDAMSTLPRVEDLDLVTKPEVSPVLGEATMRVNERGCGETLSCGTGLCATAITLRAKTGVDHWDITVRGGTVRVDVTDETVALTGSATLVADVTLI